MVREDSSSSRSGWQVYLSALLLDIGVEGLEGVELDLAGDVRKSAEEDSL